MIDLFAANVLKIYKVSREFLEIVLCPESQNHSS